MTTEWSEEVLWRESGMRKLLELAIEQLREDKDAFVGPGEPGVLMITAVTPEGPYILLRTVQDEQRVEVVVRANGYRATRSVPADTWPEALGPKTAVNDAVRIVWDWLETA
jgi:hypothetical protein